MTGTLFNKKLRTNILLIAAILIIDIILAVGWAVSLNKEHTLNRKIKEKTDYITSRLDKEETIEEILAREKTHFIIKTKAEFLESFFRTSRTKLISLSNNPMLFKQRLFDIRKKIISEAESYNFSVPDDLGFEKYRVLVPKQKDVPMLNKQLDIVSEVLKVMIESGLYRLDKIEFNEPKTKENTLINITTIELPFAVSFSCREQDLFKFLYQLNKTVNIYLLQTMVVDQISNTNSINVQLTLAGVVFL
ncbi:MAG: hypothetical protein ABH952_09120 [Candidatus Omnitrophota bacterium]